MKDWNIIHQTSVATTYQLKTELYNLVLTVWQDGETDICIAARNGDWEEVTLPNGYSGTLKPAPSVVCIKVRPR